jgi:hypothetical protein
VRTYFTPTGRGRPATRPSSRRPCPRLAGNGRAWPVAEASAIIVAARGERFLSKPPRPISEASFSMLAWEGRTAQQMRGDGEAEAKYSIRVNCDLCGKRLRTGSRRRECGQTSECSREHRRPPARWTSGTGLRPLQLAVWLLRSGDVAVAQQTARAVRPGCRGLWHVPLASGQWLPRRKPNLVPVLQRLQGHGRTVHARAYRRQGALLCLQRDQAAGEGVRH